MRNAPDYDLHVTVDNFPSSDPNSDSQGWTEEDRGILRNVAHEAFGVHAIVVWGLAIVVLLLGILVVLQLVPLVRG